MSTEKNLIALRDHLGARTRSAIVTGSGWTYVDEIKQLDRALAEIATLRNGTAMAAKVIEAGERDRRALVARIAALEADNAALSSQLSALNSSSQ